MELKALIFVLSGSVFHVIWNVQTKAAINKMAFLWWAVLASAVVAFFFSDSQAWQIHKGFEFVIYTSLIHGLYFWTLTKAYKYADLSFVYPYARGVGTVVAGIGGILFFGEYPVLLGAVGIALTIIGTFIEPATHFKSQAHSKKSYLYTFLSGFLIASYLLVDKKGLQFYPTANYLCMMLVGSSLALLPFTYKNIIPELKISTYKPFLGSVFLFGAYFLILMAMKISPISYVVAARASGMLFSAILGILLFKEKVHNIRWLGIGLITLGVILIGLAKA